MRVSCSSLFAPVALLCIASCSISTRIQYQDVPLGSAVNLGGIFSGAPTLSQNAAGDNLVIARDTYGAAWIRYYSSTSTSWQPWIAAGGVFQGNPGSGVTPDNTFWYGFRDNYNAYWIRGYHSTNGLTTPIFLGGAPPMKIQFVVPVSRLATLPIAFGPAL